MNSRHEKRIDPPRLNQIPAADLTKMKADGLGSLYTPTQAEARTLEKVFQKAWDLFYDDCVKAGSPIVSALFTWDAGTSTGDFGPSNDAIYCWWKDHAGIGIEKAAFTHEDLESYLALLLLHELAHLRAEGNHNTDFENDHNGDFENDLSYLIAEYNRKYKTALMNDFAGYHGPLKMDQRRADSRSVPPAWAGLFPKLRGHRSDGKKTSSRKKRKKSANDDSSQAARRAMIRRMKRTDNAPATSKQTTVQKSYNGVSRS